MNIVETKTNSLIEAFSRASKGLFEITGRHLESFEQGIYGWATVKPSKRMRSALMVDRELLVVVSTFTDQQQRSIKFTKEHIEHSDGRLETTMAIIIHLDPEGNGKLKNWGRDRSLSILPLYGTSAFESSTDLERALCHELYSHDPFDITGPVSDDANFFGRRDEAIDLARKLQRGLIRSCLGIRKVGKTSVINRVLREIKNNYECLCVMIDCSRDDISALSACHLIGSISHTIESALTSKLNYMTLVCSNKLENMSQARSALEAQLKNIKEPIILIFDEVDYITPGSPTNPTWRTEFNVFWRNLRTIYQETQRESRALSLLVGGVSSYWFTVESIAGVENAALAFIPEEYVSPMAQGATIAMLQKLGKVAGLQISDDGATLIAESTGNMPYWARKACSYVHRQISVGDRPCAVPSSRLGPLIDTFVKEEGSAVAEVALKHLFKVHPDLLDACRQCYAGQGNKVPERAKRALRQYGIISAEKTTLSGAMTKAAFESLLESEVASISSNPPEIQSGADKIGLGEWAEELAAIGKRRNILERRLRDLALQFIRFDCMSNGKLQDIRERIISVLPDSQKIIVKHLSADEIVVKYLWTDLAKLIVKEWKLFERIIGDKEQFLRTCDVINDRFDAHAKPADMADFALYRRSLSWLEERMARLQ